MAKTPSRDPDVYAEASIAAILTIAALPKTDRGYQSGEVIQRYKETLRALRTSGGGAFDQAN